MDDRVLIFDTTLRDGEQSAGVGMTVEEKLEIARQLERLNVDVIEAGFPISSPGDFEAVQTIAREVRKPIIAALAHANAKAVERAAEALKDAAHARIHVFISSSDQHILHQLRKNREEVVEMAAKNVALARKHTDDVEFSPMDSSRTEKEFLAHMVRATVAAGATTINIPDTVGYAIPEEFADLISYLREQVPELGESVRLSVHCHDDLGMSVANSLAAVKAGARQVEGCINGLGERAGNAALEEVIMALRTRADYFGVDTQVDTKQLYATSRMISQISGFAVQPNKAVIGRNAFRHASGIHQDGLLKERTTYEIMDPHDVGVPRSELVLGKLSGRHGLNARLQELGYSPTDDELGSIYEAFKELADKKREVTDRDLIALMGHERMAVAETYTLDAVQVSCGSNAVATATVQLTDKDGGQHTEAATGTGPVDAIYCAINRIVNVPNELTEFSVNSVTEGIDAIGEVSIRIEQDGREYVGRGADTDIIVASARAYMNALNRLLAMGDVTRSPEAVGAV
ncbi:MAG: 2-isopropylmalate synthase [Chloroflexi bacterium]|nr:2-isopropylmalate synthase [Chloroflexota bacterium]MCH7655392.1 2-isopropylmalate synthase [Chloroflexota bacterium]